MKALFSVALCIVLLLAYAGTPARAESLQPVPLLPVEDFSQRYYVNQSAIKSIGDPFILPAEGAYWCYATSSSAGFSVWRSEDLVRWERQKELAYQAPADSWGGANFWAPEVYLWQGKYYLFYSAKLRDAETMRIGIAVADHPKGPFVDLKNEPLFDPGYAIIDASFFVEGEEMYLLYSRDCSENVVDRRNESHLYGVRLKPDFSGIEGEPVLLTQPDQAWEQISGPEWLWNEGPIIEKHDGRYWLFYSANYYAGKEYGVGAAVADHPLGPYAKLDNNPLLTWKEKDGEVQISGPGHNSFFTTPVAGELFAAYHVHAAPRKPSAYRKLAIDRAGFHADGTPYFNGPTAFEQLLPLEQTGLRSLLPDASANAGAQQGIEYLTDGDYGISSASVAYCWRPSSKEEAWIDYSWKEAVTADSMVLYAADGAAGSGRLILNGDQVIPFDLADLAEAPGANLRFHFAPMSILSLRVETDGTDTALCEILVLGPEARDMRTDSL